MIRHSEIGGSFKIIRLKIVAVKNIINSERRQFPDISAPHSPARLNESIVAVAQ